MHNVTFASTADDMAGQIFVQWLGHNLGERAEVTVQLVSAAKQKQKT